MWQIFLSIAILAIIVLALPKLEYEIRILRKARFDHLNARGTLHRTLIKKSLKNLDAKIKVTKAEIEQLNYRKNILAAEEQRELERTLSTIIVHNELDSISGIGPVLKERIIHSCFDGTLSSLRRASGVRGIGEEKYGAILYWIRTKEALMPVLLKNDFPGKREITQRYAETERNLITELEKNHKQLTEMIELRTLSAAELTKLTPISTVTFIKAYKGDKQAAEKATQYLLGTFPEWSKTPTWFETLVVTYGAP